MNLIAPSANEGVRGAIAALMRGQASPSQQRLAMSWMLNDLCGVVKPQWTPDNARLSDYQQGMRFVACVMLDLGRSEVPANIDEEAA